MEFIKREEVVGLIENYGKDADKDGLKEIAVADLKILAEAVKLIPTIDVGVKLGRWEEKPSRLGGNYLIYACSVCGKQFTFHPGYDFCPSCGADMREGAE